MHLLHSEAFCRSLLQSVHCHSDIGHRGELDQYPRGFAAHSRQQREHIRCAVFQKKHLAPGSAAPCRVYEDKALLREFLYALERAFLIEAAYVAAAEGFEIGPGGLAQLRVFLEIEQTPAAAAQRPAVHAKPTGEVGYAAFSFG